MKFFECLGGLCRPKPANLAAAVEEPVVFNAVKARANRRARLEARGNARALQQLQQMNEQNRARAERAAARAARQSPEAKAAAKAERNAARAAAVAELIQLGVPKEEAEANFAPEATLQVYRENPELLPGSGPAAEPGLELAAEPGVALPVGPSNVDLEAALAELNALEREIAASGAVAGGPGGNKARRASRRRVRGRKATRRHRGGGGCFGGLCSSNKIAETVETPGPAGGAPAPAAMTANPMVANSRPSGVLNIKAASARLDTLIVGEGKGFAAFTADLENPIFKLFYSNSAPIIYRVSLNRGKSKEEKEEIIQTVRYMIINVILLSVYKHLLKEREKNPSLPVKQALLPVAQQLRDFKTMADAYVPNETTEQKALKSFLTGMASFSTIVLTRAIQGESFKSIVELIRASSFPKAKASA